jgi:2-C-methyl-D-erythritol 4-phosphate cytidylyltransferase
MPLAAVIVASGSSRRMGFDKLAAPLAGVPVLRRSVETFLACDFVGPVIVVCPAGRFDSVGLNDLAAPSPIRIDGGPERQSSVALGVAAVPENIEFIAVHDGARPLVTREIIAETYARARESGAATAARPVNETLKRGDARNFTCGDVDRENLWLVETPQIFRADLLRQACRVVAEQNATVTDDVSAVELLGVPARLVPSPTPNPKITRPEDLPLAEKWVIRHSHSICPES